MRLVGHDVDVERHGPISGQNLLPRNPLRPIAVSTHPAPDLPREGGGLRRRGGTPDWLGSPLLILSLSKDAGMIGSWSAWHGITDWIWPVPALLSASLKRYLILSLSKDAGEIGVCADGQKV